MVHKKEITLDKNDRKLLYCLDLDGRSSLSKLAKETGMSKQLVKYRIDRMEKSKIINGYSTLIDTSKLGLTTFRVYLKLKNITSRTKDSFLTYLKKEKNIWAVVFLSGKWDIALGITIDNIYEFYGIWDEILLNYLELISDYNISIYSPIYHYSKAYILGEKTDISEIRILGGKGKCGFDNTDIILLKTISKNARISLLNLAKKINLTPEATSYRLKKLQKNRIIQGYRALIDVSKLGYQFYKAEIRLSNYTKNKQIIQFCHQHPNIYQVDKTIGGAILEIEFHVRKLKDMLSIIEQLGELFPNTIETFEYITVLSEEKHLYMPM